ncbi:HlyD family secretion protein [Nordella sp. HKS 07]|uniref:HlyD family secretion protein n=1 Tax=Nordella sp. HKS 07 TaxID=2712222 RepID=UPI0013E0EE3D|nr:HlyD family secretion protein [Nordella sp. HKS 07]QIG49370.1 HlyD family secretion protein [Nordella sp. HKS 07]
MSKHEAAFTVEKTVPAAEAVPGIMMPEEAHLPLPVEPATMPKAGLKRWLRVALFAGVAVAALTGAADYGWDYWTVGRFLVSTDDAYVKADSTTIAPRVSGYIAAVLVNDNQPVKAGEILARIDDRDFKVALEQAQAQVASAEANIANKQAALVAKQAEIDAARATVVVDQANQTFATQENERYAELAKKGFGTVQNAQQAASRLDAARAAVARDTAVLANTTKELDVSRAEVAQAQASLAAAKAGEDQAQLNLSYTTLVAPIDGLIGNRTLRVGQYVQAGTQLMAVVPTHDAYIIANYKETQLTDVHAGQSVEVEVDTFPGKVFKGHVDSLSPASGQEFALLPPDNATGNFTKVVQRIPVKIVLDQGSPLSIVLRPGMSVYPTIDTKTGETTRLASSSSDAIN